MAVYVVDMGGCACKICVFLGGHFGPDLFPRDRKRHLIWKAVAIVMLSRSWSVHGGQCVM